MATSKTLLPPPYQTLLDIDGAAVANGTVTFLDTGTAALAVVYADAEGLVISANPLTVDAAGRFTVFLTPGQVVDVEYRDSHGTLVKTVPGVSAVPSASGSVDTTGTVGQAVTAGQVLMLSDGSWGGAGQWYPANNAGVLAVRGLVGVALVPAAAGGVAGIRTSGRVTGLSGLVVGQRYYLSTVPGGLALSPLRPSVWSRYVGQADSTTSLVLYANPPELAPADVQDYTGVGGVQQFIPTARTIRLANASILEISGIKAGYHGQRLRFLAVGAQVDFLNNNAGAGPEDRLYNIVGLGPTSLNGTTGRGVAEYEYDASSVGWRLMYHEQGGWIDVPFSASFFGGGGGMLWTVEAADVIRNAYYLRGAVLDWQLTVNASSIGGVSSAQLFVSMPVGYNSRLGWTGAVTAFNAGSTVICPCWQSNGGSVILSLDLASSISWVLSTNSTYIWANMRIGVQ